MLNKPIPAGDILQLITYRRILTHKYCNPNYVHEYSVQMIASRVIRLTVGCVSRCNTPERCLEDPCEIDVVATPTTTSTTTLTTCKSYILYNTATSSESFLIGNCDTGQPETILLEGTSSVCIQTFIPLNVSANIVVIETNSCTTSTTSSTSSSTTTTTTLPCNCVDIIISQVDLDNATGNNLLPFFNGKVLLSPDKDITCENEDVEAYYSVAGTYTYCLKGNVIPTITLQYVKDNDMIIIAAQSQIVNLGTPCLVNGECISTTTTSTSSSSTTTTSSTSSTTTTSSSSSTSTTSTTTSSTSSTTSTTTTLAPSGFNTIYTHFEAL